MFFGMALVHSNVFGDVNLRIQNLEHLLRSLKNYYKVFYPSRREIRIKVALKVAI